MKAHSKLHRFLIDNGYIYKRAYVKYFPYENIFLILDFSKPYKDKLYIDFFPSIPLAVIDDSWPFYPISPLHAQYLYPNGELHIDAYAFNLKDKAVYEGLIIGNLTKIEAKLTNFEELHQVLKWMMNEAETLPKAYEFIFSDERHDYIIEKRLHIYPNTPKFLILKILYCILVGDIETASHVIQHKALDRPYLQDINKILKGLIEKKEKIRLTELHKPFLPKSSN